MITHHSTLQLWTKTMGIIVFGAFIGVWLGHQDKHYQPGPSSVMETVAVQQVQYLPASAQNPVMPQDQRPQI
ncbi:hypothetical protein A6M27_00885 [Acidithiobacillus thiooxidans]|jgi:hypothetical protein|uniref:Uncharacterized protein n=1 Tax=Acidithiobacillus thiooxidans TaxID=930 RepID=A0A1C2I1Y7_ACITH|nr:hypothetical protein [Acidithiobacillus thiooxidans]OCX70022.1 hypothetical protein A6P07_15495 [Acidithiobacillus thiooxidans]OCX73939.1 hypothetical protein A6M23_07360 [Acidithiobacillus thiooxidans]OCX76301.1 hypothetical protein A6O24_08830 [Acidithiobacillus thiooxidans]OCX80200.1 hypothetical protein A6O26_15540 [Acidithiobacillus thiooxidans]OCX86271.1 hypothetical protein A6P08_06430 [Acidithiobacillus thiooxidans]